MNFLQRLRQNYRYGLLGQSLLSRLRKIGLNIKPYFVYIEDIEDRDPNFSSDQFRIAEITKDNAAEIIAKFPDDKRIWPHTWQRRLSDGELGLVLWDGSGIAGFTWAARNVFPSPSGRAVFNLPADAVYLHDMVISENYRGRSLASKLRSVCYQAMLAEKVTMAYSATLYFNQPAIRFKEKIGARKVQLRIETIFFKKLKSDICLRKYEA